MYKIRILNQGDIFKIMQWRNEQINVLRQKKKLLKEDQIKYFNKSVFPEYDKKFPEQILFGLIKNNILIGYGGLVHISWEDKRSELSFLVETKRTKNRKIYKQDLSSFIKLIKKYAFMKLEMNRIFTETYEFRTYHISILEKNNFILEGKMRKHIFFEGKYYDSLIHGILRNEYELEK